MRLSALLVLLLALALGVRLWLLLSSSWLLEGDDALSALMALRILDGDRPIMLKNQTYAAAWEPYAMALSFSVLGVSRVAAKLPALIGSLALIGTTWWLGREAGGKLAGWFAAVLAALPPAYAVVLSLKPWAPYTEVILFGSVCLACALRLAWPRVGQHDVRWAVGSGVAGGLALWMHPLAVGYLATATLTVLAGVHGKRLLSVGGGGLVGFVVGGLPIWLFNLLSGGATFQFVLRGSQGQTADRLEVLKAWWSNDVPRAAGLWHPWGPSPWPLGLVLGVLLTLALLRALFLCRSGLRTRPLDAVLLFLVLVPLLYVLSGFGGPSLNPYGFDATGRYAPPIWYALAVVVGSALATLWRLHVVLALGVGGLALLVNLAGCLAISPLEAFQSPYWDKLPASNAPLLEVLRSEGVEYVWMNHWAGQPVMFDARANGQTLIAYDWYDVQAGGIDRFPEYLPLVEQARRPAFVLVTDDAEPELEDELRLMGVSFVERRVTPYVVVIPASRRVHPSEVTGALDYRY